MIFGWPWFPFTDPLVLQGSRWLVACVSMDARLNKAETSVLESESRLPENSFLASWTLRVAARRWRGPSGVPADTLGLPLLTESAGPDTLFPCPPAFRCRPVAWAQQATADAAERNGQEARDDREKCTRSTSTLGDGPT